MKEELRKSLVTEFEKMRDSAGDAMALVEVINAKDITDINYLQRCFNEIAFAMRDVYPMIDELRSGINASKVENQDNKS